MKVKLFAAVAAVMAVLLGTAVAASANAANPLPDASGTANVIGGAVTQNPDGSWHVVSGTVDVQVGGTWNWGELSGSSQQTGCDNRFGVGWAVDWSGISTSTSAALPGSLGTLTIGGGGGKKGGGSKFFHVFEPDMLAAGNVYQFTGPCTPAELALDNPHPSGPWSATHTYSTGQNIPEELCVNMYDLHGSPGALKPATDIDPLDNNDNSIDKNNFDPGTGVGYCFAPTFVNSQELIGHIYDCPNNAATANEVTGGFISASGPSAVASTGNPLDDHTVKSGNYTVNGVAPPGYHFVTCGTGVQIGTPTTATLNNVNVPVNGTGTAIFFVEQDSAQNLVAHIYDCNSGATTNEVFGGSISASGPTTVSVQGNPVNAAVDPGAYTVNAGAPPGTHFVSCAVAGVTIGNPPNTASQTTNVPANGTGTAIFYVAGTPNLSIHKSTSATQVVVNDTFDFTLDVVNNGNGPAKNTVVTDAIPAGLAIIGTPTTTAGTCDAPAGQNITCHLGDLASQATASITIHVKADGTVCGVVNNTGHVAADNNAIVDSNTVSVTIICPTPGLQIIKSASATTVTAGDSFSYTLVVNSIGGDTATSVVVTDAIPAGLHITGTPTTTKGTCDAPSGQNITCHLGDLAAANANGGTKTATIVITVSTSTASCGTVTNTGHASAANVTTVDSNPVDVTILCPINGVLDKTNDADGDGSYHQSETADLPNQDVPFRVTLTNTSAVPVVIDSISDAWVDPVGALSIEPNCDQAFVGQTVAAGASLTCDFTLDKYSPAAGTSITNTATVTVHDKANPDRKKTVESTSVVNTAGVPPLSLTVVKTNNANGDNTFSKDETGPTEANVPFRVTITNNSAVDVVLDTLTDVWPGAAEISPACAAQVLNIPIAPGATVTCDFTVAKYIPVSTDGPKVNTVTVSGHEKDHPNNKTTQKDTSTVRGEAPAVLGTTVVRALPRTGANTPFLVGLAILLLVVGFGLTLVGNGRLPRAALALRSSAIAAPVRYTPAAFVVERRLGTESRRKSKGR